MSCGEPEFWGKLINNAAPISEHIILDNMEQFNSYFDQDRNDWGVIKEFDLFTVEMVREPLLDECRIQPSEEERYDRAMAGI